MAWRVWVKAVAAVGASAAFAAGQPPSPQVSVTPPALALPPGAADGPQEGVVITVRTTGQRERKVRVVRKIRTDAGELLADLHDLTTGARYTVPVEVLAAMARPLPRTASSPPVTAQAPARWKPASGGQPSGPTATSYNPFPRPTSVPREGRPPVKTALPPHGLSTGVSPGPAVQRPSPPTVKSSAVQLDTPPSAPALVNKVRPATLVTDPVPFHLVPGPQAAAGDPMAEETGPYLRELFGALRPSIREWAATALAEGRYGSRTEVKAQLAKAAAEDPCPDVRAHCVRLLARLGYHEPRYVGDLAAWAESGPSPVKIAARDALTGLAAKD
jgi:hypothetical protein